MNQNDSATQDELQKAINSITSGAAKEENSSSDVVSQITSKISGGATEEAGTGAPAGIFTPPVETVTPGVAAGPVAQATIASPTESVPPVLPPAPAPEIPAIEEIVPGAALEKPVEPIAAVAPEPVATVVTETAAPQMAEVEAAPAPEAKTVPTIGEILNNKTPDQAVSDAVSVTNETEKSSLTGLQKVKSEALSELRPILEKVDAPAEKKFMVYKDIIEVSDDKSCIEPAYNAAKGIKDDKERAEALLYVVESIDDMDK
ncbi:hypothetical protein IKF15_00995 [Candidatus Saccharibacteria bacterium]|nr:hypothetical protein [Candidatus Saccharibacteria bacterium]